MEWLHTSVYPFMYPLCILLLELLLTAWMRTRELLQLLLVFQPALTHEQRSQTDGAGVVITACPTLLLVFLLFPPKVEGVPAHAVLLDGPCDAKVFVVINCGHLHSERIPISSPAWLGLWHMLH